MPIRVALLLAACLGGPLAAVAAEDAPAREPVFADLEGHPVRLSDRRGELLLVNFWATWCAPCRKEMPVLVGLADELGPRGLTVLGIATDGRDEAAKVRAVMQQLDVRFDVWTWANAFDLAYYGVGPGVPATILVDRAGRVLHRLPGPVTKERLRPLLEPLLARPEAAAAPAPAGP